MIEVIIAVGIPACLMGVLLVLLNSHYDPKTERREWNSK